MIAAAACPGAAFPDKLIVFADSRVDPAELETLVSVVVNWEDYKNRMTNGVPQRQVALGQTAENLV